jgi:CRP-like cAMP-binding protein
MRIIKDLKEADLFKDLTAYQIQRIAKHVEERSFQPQDVIFSQGEPAQHLYILLEGEVTLGVKARGEVDITAYSVDRRGEAFGLSSVIKPFRNNVSAFCKKRARVLVLDGARLRAQMRQNGKMGLAIMERVAEIYFNRLNSTRAMITNLFKMFKFQTGKTKLMETYYET